MDCFLLIFIFLLTFFFIFQGRKCFICECRMVKIKFYLNYFYLFIFLREYFFHLFVSSTYKIRLRWRELVAYCNIDTYEIKVHVPWGRNVVKNPSYCEIHVHVLWNLINLKNHFYLFLLYFFSFVRNANVSIVKMRTV
jgi:hypothetical protein